MDQTTLERHFAQAVQHVLAGERHIARQRARVMKLESAGFDSGASKKLLAQFEAMQAMHIADCDQLRKELAAPGEDSSCRGQFFANEKSFQVNRYLESFQQCFT